MPTTTSAKKDTETKANMYVTTVMPLLRTGLGHELTYFSKLALPIGSVISVPLRGKKGKGIVLSSTSVENEKLTIKRGGFALRKILSSKGILLFQDGFLKAAQQLAEEYASSMGAVIRSLVPNYILEHGEEAVSGNQRVEGHLHPPRYVFEAPWRDRVSLYQNTIRSSFARQKSVVLIAPTIEEVRLLTIELKKGIEHRVFSFTGDIPKKKFLADWKRASNESEPVALIGTPSLLSLPRTDIGSIFIERESARSYALPQRPYLSVPRAATLLGKSLGATVVLADDVLSITTAYEIEKGTAETFDEYTFQKREKKNISLLDVRRNRDEPRRTFSSLHPILERKIQELVTQSKHVFLFTSRKGLGNVVVCNDCGTRVSCKTCDGAVTLNTIKQKRVFFCNACESSRSAHEKCVNCDSWNLLALGLGSERIYGDVLKLIPKDKVFLLDQNVARDHKNAALIRTAWRESVGGVLVGTELALPYIREGVTLAAIVSLDSLLALPEWRVHERVFSLVTTLADIGDELLIQTRRPTEEILLLAKENQVREFRERELSFRKKFLYPPYSTLITLTLIGSKARIEKESTSLLALLKTWNPSHHTTGAPREQTRVVIVLKTNTPIQADLVKILRTLPPFVSIAINPESTY